MSSNAITRRGAASSLAAPLIAQSPATRPNILLLHCHDLGQHLHSYGIPTVQTPNLDRLASQGVLFTNNFCSAPQCSPSRASLFTGRYPHQNGVMGLTHGDFAWDLHPSEQHLSQLLSKAGYRTAAFGILHETHSGPQRCGFADYDPAALAAPMADNVISRLKAFKDSPGAPFYLQAGCTEPHRLAQPDRISDQGFLGGRLQPDSSLGIHIPPFLKDTPGTRAELAELQGAIRHMDSQMGRILTALSDLGLEQNTLVVFTTDHGIAMPRAKCSLYEPGLRTSYILRYPRRPGWSGGKRLDHLVSNIDNVPTLLDAAGIPIPSSLAGRSLAPLLDGGSFSPRDRIFGEMTYHDYYDPRRSVRSKTHKLIVNFTSAPAFMDPSQSWRPRADTVVPVNHALAYHPPIELYDLITDPWEQQDIASKPASAPMLSQLRQDLFTHLRNTRDPILAGAVTSPMHTRSQRWLSGDSPGL